jgi:hypothetical protein
MGRAVSYIKSVTCVANNPLNHISSYVRILIIHRTKTLLGVGHLIDNLLLITNVPT